MGSKDILSPEFKDYPVQYFPAWLGGMFEIAGSMGFSIRLDKRKYIYADPTIAIVDNDLDRIKRLEEVAGGNIYARKSERSYQWVAKREHAVRLAELMKNYALSRQETIDAFINWGMTDSSEERVEIAKTSRSVEREYPDLPVYMNLVANLDFLGGIIDARGTIAAHEQYSPEDASGYILPGLHISSTNRPLVEALFLIYGGRVRVASSKGEEVEILGNKFTFTRESLQWNLQKSDPLLHVISIVRPHLHLREVGF